MQSELNALKEACDVAKERAKIEAVKSDKIRVAANTQQQQLQRQLREIESENARLATALAKKRR
jgi:flagellar motility protein MotE (MotC chaperone)